MKKTRIINIERYLIGFKQEEKIRIGTKVNKENIGLIKRIGFNPQLQVGETVIPNGELSKKALENVEGKYIIRKDLPKETAERYSEWPVTDWGGNEHWVSGFIPYQRYQRQHLAPTLYEMMLIEDSNNDKWIVSGELINIEKNYNTIKDIANLFLSIFGECEVLNQQFEKPIKKIRTLSWEILRQGEITKERINSIINENVSKSKKNMYKRNVQKLLETCDETIAIGKQEFRGYIVFEYKKKNITVLESFMPNNATYILGEDWESISKLSKTEVLNQKLYKKRIYHYSDWEEKISKIIC